MDIRFRRSFIREITRSLCGTEKEGETKTRSGGTYFSKGPQRQVRGHDDGLYYKRVDVSVGRRRVKEIMNEREDRKIMY